MMMMMLKMAEILKRPPVWRLVSSASPSSDETLNAAQQVSRWAGPYRHCLSTVGRTRCRSTDARQWAVPPREESRAQ